MKTTGTTVKRYVVTIVMLLSVLCAAYAPASAVMDMTQTLSDGAQRDTIAFDGFGFITGTFEAQSFFPPGKVADYWGFQYLRDNTPNGNGHNTSFLTNCAYSVLYTLNAEQFAMLKTLATSQVDQINLYGYKRFPLMKAFRRQLDGDIPAGSTGLSLDAVKTASSDLYKLDGQISFDRAVVYADIYRTLSTAQKAYLDTMKAGGFDSWTVSDEMEAAVRDLMKGVSNDVSVALMTYAGDLFSWYAGSLEGDVYFCPERQGTYFGSFYIKDAPAIGHEGYKIDEQLTASAGQKFLAELATTNLDSLVTGLVDKQRNNLYAGTINIVQMREDISTLLRSLITTAAPSASALSQVKEQVLAKSGMYGELDGEIVHSYTMAFAQVYQSMTATQKANLAALRKTLMSGTYNGESFDFSVCTTPFLYSAPITDKSLLDPYIANTDYLFGISTAGTTTTTTPASTTTTALPVTTTTTTISEDVINIYPSSVSVPAIGRIGLVRLTAATGSVWTAASNAEWIKILWRTTGTGNGWILYSVSANTGSARTGTINISGTLFTVNQKANLLFKDQGSFSLTSDVGVDGGTLPADYTCDGTGSSPALSWSNAPAGTKEFALMMTTLPGDGTTKWSWVLYGIPATTTSLTKNSSGVGILGVSHRSTMAYEPPCSQGPGAKLYTLTLYALSESPQLPDAADQVTGDVLTKAISSITLGSASLNLSYTRP